MSNNEIFDNLGAPSPDDPLSITGTSSELIQSALRDRMETVSLLRSTNFETFPLYAESFLLSIIQDHFEKDDIFTYNPDDELASRIMLTTNWNRGTNEGRDRRPVVVVAHQSSGSEEIVLRNAFEMKGVNEIPIETKGLQDTSSFRIAVMHHNRNLTLFLASTIRAKLASSMDLMRSVFNLFKVYPPSLSGPGNIEEYSDLFGAFIDLRTSFIPKWRQLDSPIVIRKIIISTSANAGKIMQDAIVDERP